MQRATVLMQRKGGALWAAEPKAGGVLSKIPQGSTVTVRVIRSRSARQNAMYWRVLERVVEATERWRTPEELHVVIKIALGLVDIVHLIDGRRVLVPQSTSFEAMTQDEAQTFYDSAYDLLCNEIMGGCTVEELLQHAGVRQAA